MGWDGTDMFHQRPPHGQAYGQAGLAAPSLGYDPEHRRFYRPIDTAADVENLRAAMKGKGCDNHSLILILASPKYRDPWHIRQLAEDYNRRFLRDLDKDIKEETGGDFEDALRALIRGPLEHDVYTLDKAMSGPGTDETALADVLLLRSNADLRAIAAAYRQFKGKDLLEVIKKEVNEKLFRLYSMILSYNRPEPGAPVIPVDIESKVTELHRATEGNNGGNAIAVGQIFASSNDAQIEAIAEAYYRKYHRGLGEVIEDKFSGDMEDALLHMLLGARDKPRADADWLREPLVRKIGGRATHFIYRLTTLYWDRARLERAKDTYKRYSNKSVMQDVGAKNGPYESLVATLLGEE